MDKKNRLVIRCDDEFLKLIDDYKALNRYSFANDNSRSNIVRSIVEKYIKGYSLKWNSSINAFQIVEQGKSYITYNQISADDTYTFFRLLGLILDKGKHNGVFYIRAESYRKEVLEAMLKMIELLYKNQYIVFLYNADITCKRMEKEVIELPNYLVIGGKMNVR